MVSKSNVRTRHNELWVNGAPISMIRANSSALPLFVLRILADDPDNAFALDDFALVAHRLHGSSNLHL